MRYPIRAFLAGAVLLVFSFAGRPAIAQQDTTAAQALMRDLGAEVIEVISDHQTMTDMIEDLRRLFTQNFDTDTIGRFVLGRYWNVATAEQQTEYLGLFREFIIQTYARRFTEYSNEEVVVQSARPEGDRDVMVISRIIRQAGPPVSVDWRIRQRGGRAQIIDVIIEGVSMALTFRDEYRSIIERNGGRIEPLLEALRRQIDQATRRG